jgi:hypothetical protein
MRFVLLALLLLPFSYAASDYLVAVSEDAPATDVIFAANFASAMKQQENVEFSGVIDQDVYDDYESIPDLSDKSLVILNGDDKYALYIRGSGTSSKHKSVAMAAAEYLEDKGYDVVMYVGVQKDGNDLSKYYPSHYLLQRSDLLVQPLQEHNNIIISDPAPVPTEPENEPETEEVEQEVSVPEPAPIEIAQEPAPEPVAAIEETPPSSEPAASPVQRFFGWLRGLFS